MKRTHASLLALTLVGFSVGTAFAADASAPKTREQVKAELAEAIRAGDIIGNDQGMKLNEINASAYPAKPAVVGKTREQVKAELAEAIRTGDIIGNSQTGQKLNEIYPTAYPAKARVVGKTREQVKAELAEAIRTGAMPVYIGA